MDASAADSSVPGLAPGSYKVGFGLFRELAPDHQPQVGLSDAIDDLSAGLERMAFADPDFRNSRLVRLRVLDDLRAAGLLTDALEWAQPAPVPRG